MGERLPIDTGELRLQARHVADDGWPEFAAMASQAADELDRLRSRLHERDMEWWQACALVDNVAPTPEAVKDWIAREQQYHIEQETAELRTELDRLRARVAELEAACSRQNAEICQTLGKALGFPWYKDDQANFSGATEADGVCVGELLAEDVARLAAERIAELEAGLRPFADAFVPPEGVIHDDVKAWFFVGDCRRAARLLAIAATA